MKTFLLHFTMLFFSLHCMPIGIIEINDESDIFRVKNNVLEFWSKHADLISDLKKKPLLQSQLKAIETDGTWIVKDYKSSRDEFMQGLKKTIIYVKDHHANIEKELGSEEFYQFEQGLIALWRLVHKIPSSKPHMGQIQ